MPAVITPTFRRNNAKRIYNAVQSGTEDFYIGIGKNDSWKNDQGVAADDNASSYEKPSGSDIQVREALMNLIALKSVNITDSQAEVNVSTDNNVAFVIPHYRYKTGLKYKAWDPNDTQCFYSDSSTSEQACYAVVDNSIFICVRQAKDSVGSPVASTAVPSSSQQLGVIATLSDNYSWVKVQDKNVSVSASSPLESQTLYIVNHPLYTRSYIPVLGRNTNIQDIAPSFIRFKINSSGQGYAAPTAPNTFHTCKIYGDGTGGVANVSITDGRVSNITLGSEGTGYTYGYIDFSKLTATGTSTPVKPDVELIYTPKNGFGRDPINELPTWFVGFTSVFDGSELEEFPISTELNKTDYRQISLIKNPQFNRDGVDPINTTALLRINYTVQSGTENFSNGDILEFYSDTAMNNIVGRAHVDFKGTIDPLGVANMPSNFGTPQSLAVDTANTKYILVHQNYEVGLGELNPTSNKPVRFRKISSNNERTVDTTTVYSVITNGIVEPEYKRGTGEVLFLENRGPVVRDASQIEAIKIILQF